MSEFRGSWRGLHNHGWHGEYSLALNAARCMNPKRVACFDEWCAPDAPCRCCLAAEVQALRYKRDADRDERMQLRDELNKAREQVQRVRELHKGTPECAHCAGVEGMPDGSSVETCDECAEVMPCPTIRALDGDA